MFPQAGAGLAVVHAVSSIFRDQCYRLKRNNARFKFLVEDWKKQDEGRMVKEIEACSATASSVTDFRRDQGSGDGSPRDSQAKAGDLYWVGVCFPRRSPAEQRPREDRRARGEILRAGQDAIRLTNKQNLLITNVPEANLPALKATWTRLGLNYNRATSRRVA
jgi:sulfite reductase beta subunit-like hemoprotein